jgi:hypothetical protein
MKAVRVHAYDERPVVDDGCRQGRSILVPGVRSVTRGDFA